MAHFVTKINELKTLSKNDNTAKSTTNWVNTYDEWRKARDIKETLETTDPVVLNLHLWLASYLVRIIIDQLTNT